ncbi:MAG: formylglycine-generating enzyme family protein [Desulfarculaceae bacterium]|nr:formylglycine-generating enzyme family protein [Desulfarculaceae bacterium]MCF8046591.1 formylglycine-generating enzyme family protein [Desulfarculaceae bacterium]MCF8066057.1 formylglycine-generating enzyme family protein [Desulfarculaceae bacterium]MCF8098320.1 formylglycine-generating enzyme family protein [Desulfarculaceae bacterium]MCF8122726.1 formylglycine-generating enzyme family protein [Desulfarculaceae bacterium]
MRVRILGFLAAITALAVCLSASAGVASAAPDYSTLPAKYAKLPKKVANDLGMEFVLIPPGTFMMGSPESEPGHQKRELLHQVTLTQAFYMQATEVTLGQWQKVMGKRWLAAKRPGGPNSPVVQVSWYQAQQFIYKLNHQGRASYRLPTEAEWEYAARAGNQGSYPWGEGIDCNRAMYANNSLKKRDCQNYYKSRGLPLDGAAPVKSFPPNAWGLYDMAGNVWEWVADWLGDYPAKPVSDPQGPVSGEWRVRRGGSWFGIPHYLRSANRNFAHPASKYNTLGFRLVKEIR